MILDHISHAETYRSLHPLLARAFAYLQQTDFASLATGRHDIAGNDLYAMMQSYTTKPEAEARWESHRTYLDIQYMISGSERMGIAPIHMLQVKQDYDPNRDAMFFTGRGHSFTLETGQFAIFYPQDGHMPGLQINGPGAVRKVVLKVRA